MSAAPLDTLKEIFHSARSLAPTERDAFLDAACGTDERLRREIDALLASDRAAADFIADSPEQLAAELFAGPPVFSEAGRIIGQYRLVECIGAGGMGVVYLAERADQQFEMQVALKLIKRGMDTDSVLRRFHGERQILASLEHPNIARLLDGGTTDDGLPYFVMEYIRGIRIDRCAEEQGLSINARLKLFRQVCSAVSYAHQHLVVHRDLKPSNILVTPEGTPKLLDFGIAKIIQPDDGAEALATITLLPAMTPEYASPEQIEGGPATTLSDVFSLGAVLYELLSAQPPYQLQNRSPQEVAKAVSTAQIQKPSTVARRGEDARRLRGDLDNIVLMAMRKETARRYRSVEQFSEDIRRYLAGRPVIARRDTFSYRATKFVRRNRLAISAAALLFFTLIGGIVATAWQARKARVQEQRALAEKARAERRFNEVRKLAHSVVFDYHDAIRYLPGSTKVRERLVKDALTYLDSLAAEAQGDPALQNELATAYDRVGEVRGGLGGNLGDTAGALDSFRKALTIREAVVAANPKDVQARIGLAYSHEKIGGWLLENADAGGCIEHFRTAIALYVELAREQPANDDIQLGLAVSYHGLGHALGQRRDWTGALEQFRSALAVCEKPGSSGGRDQRYGRALWNTYRSIAKLQFEQGDVAGAIDYNKKALALGEALIAQDPINTETRRGLALTYKNAARYRGKSDPRAAVDCLLKAAAIEEELYLADPANAPIRNTLASTHKRIAESLANMKEHAQALSHFSKAREIFEKAAAEAPGDFVSRFLVATCGAGAAGMHARLGEIDRALQECGKSVALLRETKEDLANADQRSSRAEACEYLGYAYAALAETVQLSPGGKKQHMKSARDMFQEGVNVLQDLRSRGLLAAAEEGRVKSIAAEVAKCDEALAK